MQEKIEKFLKSTWFKIGLLILALIIACSIFYYFTIYPRQQKQYMNNIDLQKKCDSEAKKIFAGIQRGANSINYTYKNHYINSLSRCYILIHGIGIGDVGLSDKLINAFADETIANCESFTTAPEINFCSYNGSSGIKYDIDQFNNFVKPYMEMK